MIEFIQNNWWVLAGIVSIFAFIIFVLAGKRNQCAEGCADYCCATPEQYEALRLEDAAQQVAWELDEQIRQQQYQARVQNRAQQIRAEAKAKEAQDAITKEDT